MSSAGAPPTGGPRPTTASGSPLESLFARVEAEAEAHLTGGPSAEDEIRTLELTLGRRLPASFRAFLTRLGGGLYFQKFEILGPHTVLVHDIELVSDIASHRRDLASAGPAVPVDDLIPFFCAEGQKLYFYCPAGSADEPPVVDAAGRKYFDGFVPFLAALLDKAAAK